MTTLTTSAAYLAVRVLLKSGVPKCIPAESLRYAERELIGELTPELVTSLEMRIAQAAHEYQYATQAAKYAAVCP